MYLHSSIFVIYYKRLDAFKWNEKQRSIDNIRLKRKITKKDNSKKVRPKKSINLEIKAHFKVLKKRLL